MAKNGLYYRVWMNEADYRGSYEHLTCEVYTDDPTKGVSHRATLSFDWQRNKGGDGHTYGAEITDGGSLESKVLAVALLRRLYHAIDWDKCPYAELDAAHLLDALDKLRAVQVVYDNRLNQLVGLGDVLPDDIHAYRDDYHSVNTKHGGCMFGAEARTREEARAIILRKCADEIAKGGGWYIKQEEYQDWLSRWLAAGMPVVQMTDQAPDTRPARELWNIPVGQSEESESVPAANQMELVNA